MCPVAYRYCHASSCPSQWFTYEWAHTSRFETLARRILCVSAQYAMVNTGSHEILRIKKKKKFAQSFRHCCPRRHCVGGNTKNNISISTFETRQEMLLYITSSNDNHIITCPTLSLQYIRVKTSRCYDIYSCCMCSVNSCMISWFPPASASWSGVWRLSLRA